MRSSRSSLIAAFGGLLLVACSNGTGPGEQPASDCTEASAQVLAVGEYRVIDPAQTGSCVRFPDPGPSGAEHLYVALSTAGRKTGSGISAPYAITGLPPTLATRFCQEQCPSNVWAAQRAGGLPWPTSGL